MMSPRFCRGAKMADRVPRTKPAPDREAFRNSRARAAGASPEWNRAISQGMRFWIMATVWGVSAISGTR